MKTEEIYEVLRGLPREDFKRYLVKVCKESDGVLDVGGLISFTAKRDRRKERTVRFDQ